MKQRHSVIGSIPAAMAAILLLAMAAPEVFVSTQAACAGQMQWAGVKGMLDMGVAPIFGAKGVANPANRPGARGYGALWTDNSGALWLFGGFRDIAIGQGRGTLNDLWKYDPGTNCWTWMKGASFRRQPGIYGTQGIPAEDNTPGARCPAAWWKDASGKFWLFGGSGFSSAASETESSLSDLWNYDPSTGNWTWIKGSNLSGEYSKYGTMGVPAAGNTPGARTSAAFWVDASGSFWLYGGNGCDSEKNCGLLSDLWKYDPATNNWTWMGGASTREEKPVHGAQGVPDAANSPGARMGAASWTDASGLLWLFGGNVFYSRDTFSTYLYAYNDLWKYDPASGNWTWVKGSNKRVGTGVYGIQGVPDAANTPGARMDVASWTDASGKFWLLGGSEEDNFVRNDLWQYDPETNCWTWMKGSIDYCQGGHYETKGVPDAANTPGARRAAFACAGPSGIAWLFGGYGYDCSETCPSYLGDLWRYDSATGNWAWMSGTDTIFQFGTEGTRGVPAEDNIPGARINATAWRDLSNNLWLFGGTNDLSLPYIYDLPHAGVYDDLWKYTPATRNWTWMHRPQYSYSFPVYGTLGVPDAANAPGSRIGSASWTDTSGNLWLYGGVDSLWGEPDARADLWMYDIVTGIWTWMGGSTSAGNRGNPVRGVYGTLGVPNANNTPGARLPAASWRDLSGNFWMFGGYGYGLGSVYDYGYPPCVYNDLWKYDPTTECWTWMKGDSTSNAPGVYGTQGVPGAGNTPGARYKSAYCTDGSGNFWLFGGYGISAITAGDFSDLWKYDCRAGNWTWMKGPQTSGQCGTYGTQGVPGADNNPGCREDAMLWADSMGKIWLFGGWNHSYGEGGRNDLWKFDPDTRNWTWVKGSNIPNQPGSCAAHGVFDDANTPGARSGAASWTDASGKLWLFGGEGFDCGGFQTILNDMWCGRILDPSATDCGGWLLH